MCLGEGKLWSTLTGALDDRPVRAYRARMVAVTSSERELPALSHLQGSIIILATGIGFSFGGLAFRSVNIGAWEYLTYRGLGMAAVAVAVLIVRYRGRFGDLVDKVAVTHLLAGLTLGAMNLLFIVSLTFATVSFVLLLQALSPIAAAYFGWLLLRERPSGEVVIATGVAIVGIVVMVGGTIVGDLSLFGLLAAAIPIGFGLYTGLIRSATRIDPMVPLVTAGFALILVSVVVVQTQGGFVASGRDAAIGIFAGSVLLAVPLAAFNVAQRVVPASESALLILSETVLAPVWVWVFVGEKASALTLVGGAIILAAMVWLTLKRAPVRDRRPRQKQHVTPGAGTGSDSPGLPMV